MARTSTGVYLGLDYGTKRIGVAVSTPIGTVHPRERIERTTLARDLAAIRALASDVGAAAIVIGLPHHMDGNRSEMEEEARRFAKELAASCGLPVLGRDERLTTEAAESALRDRGLAGRARRARRDSAAACLVLQDFLDAGETGERIA